VTADPDFIAMLAHELRGPLAPLRTSLEVLKRPNIPESTKERARVIMERQVVQMAHLIDELVEIARIGRGQLQLQPGRCALKDIVEAAGEAAAPVLAEREQALLVDLPTPPLWLRLDRVRIVQAFSCLLSHASRSRDRGEPVRLHARVDASGVAITLAAGSSTAPATQAQRLDVDVLLAQCLLELHGAALQTLQGAELVVQLPAQSVVSDSA